MRLLPIAALAALTASATAQSPATWRPAKGPLVTRWAAEVRADKALPEYPRPQMVRSRWLNLNGLWDLAITPADAPEPSVYPERILVPFPVESALSGVMRKVTDQDRVWYRRTFRVPAAWKGRRVLLHFGAVDWDARVSVNGRVVAEHKGGYDGFSADITPALSGSGLQALQVGVWDPSDRGPQPRGKQVLKPGGIFYTGCTGIWQTVWLEPVPVASVTSLRLTPDVAGRRLRVRAAVDGSATGLTVRCSAMDGPRPVGRCQGAPGVDLSLPVPAPRLWWPDKPFLYGLKVELVRGATVVDSVDSYFGMRDIRLGKDKAGITRLMLNGRFVMEVGPLDQGFWPDGIYTAPTDAALRYDIDMTKRFGMNMARKHVKVEPERWYAWCDRLGLLIWQDMPAGDNNTPEGRKQFEVELARMIEQKRNHPSIIMWVVFNEGWGQHDTERLTAWVKKADPSRLVSNASGWTDKACGDVIDMHNYPGPGSPKPEPARAAVLGEFGGLGLAIKGHTWSSESWGYRGMADQRALTSRYADLLRRTWALKDDPGLCAAVYTQTTDVETECNGLMTYDRAVVKPDLAQMAAANLGKLAALPPVRALIPTSRQAPQPWRYTTDRPADGWNQPGFDEGAWLSGIGGFGTAGTPGSVVRTAWRTGDIWLRRTVQMPAKPWHGPFLTLHHDEDAEVFINGVLACKAEGFAGDYEEAGIAPAALAALRPGGNVIAVHCRQTSGGQFIDVGISDQPPAPARSR
jgi:hypothetical protein